MADGVKICGCTTTNEKYGENGISFCFPTGTIILVATMAGEDKLAEVKLRFGNYITAFVFDWQEELNTHVMHIRPSTDSDLVMHRLKGGK